MQFESNGSESSGSEQSPSPKKLEPNRNEQLANQEPSTASAQKSGGPRTQQGKEKSSRNSLKLGIFSKVVVLEGEPGAEFDSLLNGFRDYFEPEGRLEEFLVEKLAVIVWRHRRLVIADGQLAGRWDSTSWADGILGPQLLSPDLLLRYETTFERSFDRTLSQLERAQRMRSGQPVLPPINVNLSQS